jgi:hypothetical protein
MVNHYGGKLYRNSETQAEKQKNDSVLMEEKLKTILAELAELGAPAALMGWDQ